MPSPLSWPGRLSRWLNGGLDSTGWRRVRFAGCTLLAMIALSILSSSLPPRMSWLAEAAIGAGFMTLLFWELLDPRWFGRAVLLNAVLTALVFFRVGDTPWIERDPVFIPAAMAWGVGYLAVGGLHARLPTSRSGRQSEIVILLFALLLLVIGGTVAVLADREIKRKEALLSPFIRVASVRPAEGIERCFNERIKRRPRFSYNRDNPKDRSQYNSIRIERLRVVDQGGFRLVVLSTMRGVAPNPQTAADFARCTHAP